MNKIMLIGNLGRDPEMNYTPNGNPVTKFSLAVNRFGKSPSGERETDWFNIVAWNQLAETCNAYLKKGTKVFVEGRLVQRSYTGKDSVQRNVIEVVIQEMEILTPRDKQPSSSSQDYGSDTDDVLGDIDEHPF